MEAPAEDPELTKRYRFIAHDLPFHGKSVPPLGEEWWKKEYELHQDFLMEFVVSLKSALQLGPDAIYMGSSMGGHLAPDLALQIPSASSRLSLRSREHWRRTRSTRSWTTCGTPGYGRLRGALMFGMMAPHSPERFRRETAWVYCQGGPPVYKGDLVYYFGDHDIAGDTRKIDVTKTAVYVMGGTYDWSATPPLCKALADRDRGLALHSYGKSWPLPDVREPRPVQELPRRYRRGATQSQELIGQDCRAFKGDPRQQAPGGL